MTLDVVDGTEQEVPRVRREQILRLALAARNVVDLEAKLHGKAASLRLEHGVDVDVEIVDAPVDVVGLHPELPRLPEVIDVLGEADLVHPTLGRHLDEALGGVGRVVDSSASPSPGRRRCMW